MISPDLTTNDPEKQKQSESGGLTMDATGAENHCTILVIEPSQVQKDLLWVGTDDGRVHYTTDGGQNWTEVTKNLKGLPKGSWVAQIKASETNPGEALLVANDYRRFDYTPYAYRTTNYGKSWERIVDENDVESYALSIIQDPESPNLYFLGTDDGLYISLDHAESWKKFTNGFPTVSTKDLVIHPREKDLVIGTFGRAAWVLDDIRPLQALAKDSGILAKEIQVFDAPTAYHAAYQQPTGSRFGADAMYHGENRDTGALITVYVKEGSKQMEKKDSITLSIKRDSEIVRTLKYPRPEKSGFTKLRWGIDEKGVDRPSRTLRKSRREPSGRPALPGTYEIEVSLGETTSNATIEVELDPRLSHTLEDFMSSYAVQGNLEQITSNLAESTEKLAKAKKELEAMKAALKDIELDNKKELSDKVKDNLKTIEDLQNSIFGTIDKRQGITRNPEMTVMNRISNASRYVRTRVSGITDTEKQLMQFAEKAVNDATDSINRYLTTEYADLLRLTSDISSPLLKAVE